MMHSWGMWGIGFFGWLVNIIVVGLVVYGAVKMALKDNK